MGLCCQGMEGYRKAENEGEVAGTLTYSRGDII